MLHLLERLDGVKPTGTNRWLARCPGPNHENGDRRPSLSVRLIDGDRWLCFCFAGCSTFEVCTALGISLADLFHDRLIRREYVHGKDRNGNAVPRIRASEFLELAAHEVLVATLLVHDLTEGQPADSTIRDRLAEAYRKLSSARAEALGA